MENDKINETIKKGLDDLLSSCGMKEPVKEPVKDQPSFNIENYLIDTDAEYVDPPAAVQFTNTDGAHYPIMSRGDISVVKGPPKARKTFLTSILATAGVNHIDKYFGFSCVHDPNKNKVLFIDTEQSDKHAQRVARRIRHMSGCGKDEIMYCPLRKMDVPNRLRIIQEILKIKAPEINLMIIDGVRDLLLDFNDITQSNYIVQLLLKWSAEHDIHICVVIHTNKGDKNSRGHLGAELDNKSEIVLCCEVDSNVPDVTKVYTAISRGNRTQDFTFVIEDNETKFGRLYLPVKPGTNFVAPTYTVEKVSKIMQSLFNGEDEISCSSFKGRLQTQEQLSERDLKEIISYAKVNSIISQKNNKAPYILLIECGPVNLLLNI